jgi:hypothetical protein
MAVVQPVVFFKPASACKRAYDGLSHDRCGVFPAGNSGRPAGRNGEKAPEIMDFARVIFDNI